MTNNPIFDDCYNIIPETQRAAKEDREMTPAERGRFDLVRNLCSVVISFTDQSTSAPQPAALTPQEHLDDDPNDPAIQTTIDYLNYLNDISRLITKIKYLYALSKSSELYRMLSLFEQKTGFHWQTGKWLMDNQSEVLFLCNNNDPATEIFNDNAKLQKKFLKFVTEEQASEMVNKGTDAWGCWFPFWESVKKRG